MATQASRNSVVDVGGHGIHRWETNSQDGIGTKQQWEAFLVGGQTQFGFQYKFDWGIAWILSL